MTKEELRLKIFKAVLSAQQPNTYTIQGIVENCRIIEYYIETGEHSDD